MRKENSVVTIQESKLAPWTLPLAVLLLWTIPAQSTAGPVTRPTARQLFEQADFVVKATVSRVTELGEGANSLSDDPKARSFLFAAEVRPIHVLKGSLPAGPMTVSFDRGIHRLPVEDLEAGGTYVLFLKASGSGYVLADPVKSKVVADPDRPPGQPEGVTAEERLRAEFRGQLDSPDVKVVEAALCALGELRLSKDDAQDAARFIAAPNKALAGSALLALLESGYYEYLDDAISYMAADAPAESKAPFYASKIGGVVRQITDPAVAARLIGAMDDPKTLVRQCAAYALRQAKVRAAVPVFMKGLQDSDFDVRYQCLMGLAETVEGKDTGEWATSVEPFSKDETKYIRVWQDWWEKEGKEKTW